MIKNTGYKFVFFISLIFFGFYNFLYAQISVQYFGGAQRVSGSCALLKTDEMSVIIDCGSFYEEANLPADNSVIDKKLINADAMILTHAHNDHSGRIPLLLSEGFNGNIYCTSATKKILFEMFDDGWNFQDVKHKYFWSKTRKEKIKKFYKGTLTLHWYDECKKSLKNIEEREIPVSQTMLENEYKIKMKLCKNCLKQDLEKMQKQFVVLEYKKSKDLSDKMSFVLFDAGHIPGSASIVFYVYDKNKINTIAFSGDLGNPFSKLTPDKDIIPKADFVFVETTYGANKQNINFSDYEKFQTAISDAVKNNKIIWIPALSLHRTQKVLYEIKQAQIKGLIPEKLPIYSLSPSSNGVTKLYNTELKFPSKENWFKKEVYKINSFLPSDYKTKMPNAFQTPSIIISASGMMDKGVSVGLLNKLLPLKNVEIFLVSYASPKTPAGKLKCGEKYIKTKNTTVKVSAKINIFNIFSDHPDIDELLRWLSKQDSQTNIYLVHGEKETLKKTQKFYKEKGFINTEIAIKNNDILN